MPSRHTDESAAALTAAGGQTLWEQIHQPFASKVERKFSQAHPDLPLFIKGRIYGDLFCNFVCEKEETIGRVTTSLSAIACLRARPGFALQVFDHICGLKNAWRDGSWKSEPHVGSEKSIEWLLSDNGCIWVLRKVDELIEALDLTEPMTCRERL